MKKWRYFTLFGLGYLVFHFIMVLVYVYNEDGGANTFLYFNQKYMVPVFHQKWALFAPDPLAYDCELTGRYFSGGVWSDWHNTEKLREKHFKIPQMEATLTAELTGTNTSPRGVYYVDGKPEFDRIEKTFAYQQIYFYMYRFFQDQMQVTPDSIQIKLNYTYPPNFYTGEVKAAESFEFNAISTHEK